MDSARKATASALAAKFLAEGAVANARFTNRRTRPDTRVTSGRDWHSYAVTNSGQLAQSGLVRLW